MHPRSQSSGRFTGDLTNGMTVVEVTVALGLIAILLVPLAGQLYGVVDRSHLAERRVEELAEMARAAQDEALWDWGARPAAVSWASGPTLLVECGQVPVPLLVGAWVDGWPMSEIELPPGGRSILGTTTSWAARSGSEVLVRARVAGTAWGAPWRGIVPVAAGDVRSPGEIEAGGGECGVVIHPAGAGAAVLIAGDDPPELYEEFPAEITLTQPGNAAAGFAGQVQRWRVEPGRQLDVFF
jgi:type II secretory pathway pseudopilin PulG